MKIGLKDYLKNTYNNETKHVKIGHEQIKKLYLLMQEYCQDVLTWITDMQYSTVVNTDQKMDLIVSISLQSLTQKIL